MPTIRRESMSLPMKSVPRRWPAVPGPRHHELKIDVLRVTRQQVERAEEIGHHHERDDQQAVAHVGEIDGVRFFPERQVRELADLAGYLGIGFHSNAR